MRFLAQDLSPALGAGGILGSAPMSLTVLLKSVHGSWVAPTCGAKDLYRALGWRLVNKRELACA